MERRVWVRGKVTRCVCAVRAMVGRVRNAARVERWKGGKADGRMVPRYQAGQAAGKDSL